MPDRKTINELKQAAGLLIQVTDAVVAHSKSPEYTDEQWVADKDQVLGTVTVLNKALGEAMDQLFRAIELLEAKKNEQTPKQSPETRSRWRD